MKKHLVICLMVAALTAAAGLSKPASALTLGLSDGSNSVSLNDTATPGVASYFGSLGSWSVNVTTGISDPVLGTATFPHIDLNSVNVSGGTGTLTITLEDTFGALDPGIKGFYTQVGGTTNGNVAFRFYLNGEQTSFSSNGPVFSDIQSFLYSPDSLNTFKIEAVIGHSGPGRVTSFDAEIIPTPEPGTLLLLGSGLAGLAAAKRRKKS